VQSRKLVAPEFPIAIIQLLIGPGCGPATRDTSDTAMTPCKIGSLDAIKVAAKFCRSCRVSNGAVAKNCGKILASVV
jgi:hypothetical protein